MNGKCDLCDNNATVHEVSVHKGVRIERHLCEACAAKAGFDMHGGGGPIVDLLKQFMTQQEPLGESPPAKSKGKKHAPDAISVESGSAAPGGTALSGKAQVCPTCKTTYADFKQHGVLGCAECYKSFEGYLGPLIERAHDGGIAHTGKTPRRLLSGSPPSAAATQVHGSPGLTLEDRARRLRALQQQLEVAVKSEQYEVAAKVRDEIRRLALPANFGMGGVGPLGGPSAGTNS